MTGLVFFTVLVALVGVERLAELVISNRNAAWSLEQGGRETGRGHYTVMVVLHTGLLVGMLVEAWVRRPEVPALLAGVMLALALASQGLRWWCIICPRGNVELLFWLLTGQDGIYLQDLFDDLIGGLAITKFCQHLLHTQGR